MTSASISLFLFLLAGAVYIAYCVYSIGTVAVIGLSTVFATIN